MNEEIMPPSPARTFTATTVNQTAEWDDCARQLEGIFSAIGAYPSRSRLCPKRPGVQAPNNLDQGRATVGSFTNHAEWDAVVNVPDADQIMPYAASDVVWTENLQVIPASHLESGVSINYPLPPPAPAAPPPVPLKDCTLSPVQTTNRGQHACSQEPPAGLRVQAEDYRYLPLRAKIEEKWMPCGLKFYTVVTRLDGKVRAGTAIRMEGALEGRWIAEENVSTTDGYAFVRMNEPTYQLIALIAVPRAYVDMPS
ncbi:hypothetical protein DFH06DRAFT_1140085 [Mycena polygramma]|nr:hypothetical protein DFH06DRAFT_1140085 [Mycena polygramma]